MGFCTGLKPGTEFTWGFNWPWPFWKACKIRLFSLWTWKIQAYRKKSISYRQQYSSPLLKQSWIMVGCLVKWLSCTVVNMKPVSGLNLYRDRKKLLCVRRILDIVPCTQSLDYAHTQYLSILPLLNRSKRAKTSVYFFYLTNSGLLMSNKTLSICLNHVNFLAHKYVLSWKNISKSLEKSLGAIKFSKLR